MATMAPSYYGYYDTELLWHRATMLCLQGLILYRGLPGAPRAPLQGASTLGKALSPQPAPQAAPKPHPRHKPEFCEHIINYASLPPVLLRIPPRALPELKLAPQATTHV